VPDIWRRGIGKVVGIGPSRASKRRRANDCCDQEKQLRKPDAFNWYPTHQDFSDVRHDDPSDGFHEDDVRLEVSLWREAVGGQGALLTLSGHLQENPRQRV
jgi:hypothetical protein